jgi:hypothetical protein
MRQSVLTRAGTLTDCTADNAMNGHTRMNSLASLYFNSIDQAGRMSLGWRNWPGFEVEHDVYNSIRGVPP